APQFPPLARPGLGGHRHGLVLERLRGIARHGVKAPEKLAGLGIIGRDIAAHAVLVTAVANDDPAFDDARRHRNGVRLARVDRHDAPDWLAGSRIECTQAAVKDADEYLSLPSGNASIDDITAAPHTQRARHRGIVGPE